MYKCTILLIILIIISVYYLNINSDKEGFINYNNLNKVTKYIKNKTNDIKYKFNKKKRNLRYKLKGNN